MTVYKIDDDGNMIAVCESLDSLMEGGRGEETWIVCFQCHRFFQGKHVRIDFLGNREGCAFCSAAGFHVALQPYDAWATPQWPQKDELRYGMKLPKGI